VPEDSILLNGEIAGGLCYSPLKNEYETEDWLNILVTKYSWNERYSGYVAVHEIGHALGLDHPKNGTDPYYANSDLTVMSYDYVGGTGTPFFQPADIDSLKFLWGEENDHYRTAAPAIKKSEITKEPEYTNLKPNAFKNAEKNQEFLNNNDSSITQEYGNLEQKTNTISSEKEIFLSNLENPKDTNLDAVFGFSENYDINGSVIDPITGSEITPDSEWYRNIALELSNKFNDVVNLKKNNQDNYNVDFDLELTEKICTSFEYIENKNEHFFSYEACNTDGISPYENTGNGMISLEETLGANDNDYNDLLFGLNFQNI